MTTRWTIHGDEPKFWVIYNPYPQHTHINKNTCNICKYTLWTKVICSAHSISHLSFLQPSYADNKNNLNLQSHVNMSFFFLPHVYHFLQHTCRNGKKITSAHSTEQTKKETIQLLRTIIVLTQTLQPLPDNVMMTMKILYYDEGIKIE